MKKGKIQVYAVVVWDIPPSDKLLNFMVAEGLTNAGEVVQWNLGEKLNNTLLFSLYLRIIQKANGNATGGFYGMNAIEVIEKQVLMMHNLIDGDLT